MKQMVRCLICGAVFEAGAEACPVCGVGPENFVPAEPECPVGGSACGRVYCVLGGGAAAVSAVEAICRQDTAAKVTLVSEEETLPIFRPMLTKDFQKALIPDALHIHPAAWFRERGVTLRLGKTVLRIDGERHLVELADGETLPFDRCIYALGAESFLPPFPGRTLPGVVTIRRLTDVSTLAARLPAAKRGAVIGGGVLGLEAADALLRAGLPVTVLETADRLLPRQLDRAASDRLLSVVTAHGVSVVLNASVSAIEGDGDAAGVRLADGTLLPADLIVVSTGVRANTAAAAASGLAVGRGVTVNERMETSRADVYACGDCAEYRGVVQAMWPVAVRTGEVAGINAAGGCETYQPVAPGLTLSAFSAQLYAIGDVGMDPAKTYQRIENALPGGNAEIFYLADGRLTGGILLGSLEKLALLERAVADGTPYAGLFARGAV